MAFSKVHDKPTQVILDVGAAESPAKKYFHHAKYITQDIVQNHNRTIDYVCDLNKGLPKLKNSSFDVIICTQVLEHLKNPNIAFDEFYRILKKGGRVYLTTNFCYEEHMVPNDYYRFTRYGLAYLGDRAKLKVISINPQGGIFQVIFYLVANLPIIIFLKRQTFFYYFYLIFFMPILLIFGAITLLLDNLDKEKRLTINYECIYEK